jgi:hypothetical protein
MADAFENYIRVYGGNGSNYLSYAPGGGVENVGLAHALNDMLVQSSAGHIHLFPAWPLNEPASFVSLRVKGAFLVSAEWDPVGHTAKGVAVTASVDGRCTVASPWSPHIASAVDVSCTASTATPGSSAVHAPSRGKGEPHRQTLHVDASRRVGWMMRRGETCSLEPILNLNE